MDWLQRNFCLPWPYKRCSTLFRVKPGKTLSIIAHYAACVDARQGFRADVLDAAVQAAISQLRENALPNLKMAALTQRYARFRIAEYRIATIQGSQRADGMQGTGKVLQAATLLLQLLLYCPLQALLFGL